jgi:Zn-dependent peptidase ImmA (M78 family)/transcriptional regulator with XRE-family HTH domain
MPRVNPEILQWARETAGLTVEQAASKLKLKPAHGFSGLERLKALEIGETAPTRAQLVTMAAAYRRPLVTFYLSSPPRRGDRGRDFRQLPSARPATADALVDALIRDVRARQGLVRAVLNDEEEAESVGFIGTASVSNGIPALVSAISALLGLSWRDLQAQRSPGESFDLLRTRTEGAGVFVLLVGNLGSYHSALDLETFRGLALADEFAPFIVINDQDAKTAWCFSLLHELAHLFLGESGISGDRSDLQIERFCNDVASEFLLPTSQLSALRLRESDGLLDIGAKIDEFAESKNVSSSMVAYRLLRSDEINHRVWTELGRMFRERWTAQKEKQRKESRERDGGPNLYVVRSHRIGNALLDLTDRMLSAGALTTSKAARVLGVKPKQVGPLSVLRSTKS